MKYFCNIHKINYEYEYEAVESVDICPCCALVAMTKERDYLIARKDVIDIDLGHLCDDNKALREELANERKALELACEESHRINEYGDIAWRATPDYFRQKERGTKKERA